MNSNIMGDITSVNQSNRVSNSHQTAKKSSAKPAKYMALISPDTKSKIGQYLLLGITFCFLTVVSGGGSALPALMSSTPIIGVSLIDYHWENITNMQKLKLKDDKRGWMPDKMDISAVILPILGFSGFLGIFKGSGTLLKLKKI